VYAWFAARRGLLFTCGAVLAHWFYYFYSGGVFALGWMEHRLRGSPQREAGPACGAAGRLPQER
jgi:hypothetical protein